MKAPGPQTAWTPSSLHKENRRSEILKETPPPPPHKKRMSEVLKEAPVLPPQISPPPYRKKKKKRKQRSALEGEVLEEVPPKKEKKKKRSEVQEEVPPKKEKKKRSQVMEVVLLEEAPTQKEKKKKRSEVVEVVLPQKEKKKRRSEVLKEVPPQKEKKKKRSEVLEEVPPQKEKKRRSQVVEVVPLQQRERRQEESGDQEQNDAPPAADGGRSSTMKIGWGTEDDEEERYKESGLDPALVEELQEFFPDVKKKSLIQIRKWIRYDLHRFRIFKKQGLRPRKGRCSQEENQQIADNVSDFLSLTGIQSAQHLLFPHRFKEQEAQIKKLKVQHHFMERIGDGIPRTCEQIYIRAKKLFDEENHMGRFSEEEICTLKKLHQLHGNNWKVISDKMGRSVYALQKRFTSLSSSHGPWDQEEESRLKKAVRTHLESLIRQNPGCGLSKDQLCVNLPWKRISQEVQTRAWTQCRLKWFSILDPRLARGNKVFSRGEDGLLAKILFIDTLYEMGVDDVAHVDWNMVSDCIGNASPVCVQKTFQRLKCRFVPHWNTLSFGEIVDFLHDKVIPKLQKKVEYRKTWLSPQSEWAGPENSHELCVIFNSDEDELELDNSGLPNGIQPVGGEESRPPF